LRDTASHKFLRAFALQRRNNLSPCKEIILNDFKSIPTNPLSKKFCEQYRMVDTVECLRDIDKYCCSVTPLSRDIRILETAATKPAEVVLERERNPN
jgi:hypothetical protein